MKTWFKGTKPCKHCNHMSVSYKKWYDNDTHQWGKKYKCSHCHKEWWEPKYYNRKKETNE